MDKNWKMLTNTPDVLVKTTSIVSKNFLELV